MKSGCAADTADSTTGVLASWGAMTGRPYSAAVRATLANHCVSFGSSATVTTRGMSMPAEISVFRQRTPTSWYANTTARAALTQPLS